ncbi:FxsA family protein [Mesorhizobium sp. PUT5]|uniref:FxsA family protein n=1 Tax=Mesorhizobium sp. PUT5 TaxID=3454629 RepID=UPI003FA4B9F9
MRISILPLLLLALPLAEIAGFVVVGRQIGALATVGLVVASSIGGAMLLRHQGFGVMQKVRREIDAGHDPSRQLAHGAMIVIAALLLIVPGFITDIAALLLLLPPVRNLAWGFVKTRVTVMTDFGAAGFARRRRGPTIDLDDEDFSRQDRNGRPDPDSPWRRLGGGD